MELDKSVDNIRRKLGVKPKKPVKPGTHGVPIKLPGAAFAPASTSFELGLPVGIKFTDKRGKRTGIDRGNFKAVGRKRRSPVAQPLCTRAIYTGASCTGATCTGVTCTGAITFSNCHRGGHRPIFRFSYGGEYTSCSG